MLPGLPLVIVTHFLQNIFRNIIEHIIQFPISQYAIHFRDLIYDMSFMGWVGINLKGVLAIFAYFKASID